MSTSRARVGTRLAGRYRLVRELGRGGLGIVFLARDACRAAAGGAYPYVALKMLRDRFRRDASAQDALRREALRACSVSSPHLVRMHDLGCHDGDPFLTMEYVRGVDLRRAMDAAGPDGIARELAWSWIGDLARALHDLHGAGVIHGDVKPGNVMAAARGGIRLIDLGVRCASGRDTLTPAYARCSRLAGADAGVEDDVHAFACVAYELLAGGHPSSAEGLRASRLHGVGRRASRALLDILSPEGSRRIRTMAAMRSAMDLD